MSLKQFINQENQLRTYLKMPALAYETLTQEQATDLYRRLDCCMSPEILHADGERTAAQARALAKMYRQAFTELQDEGFEVPTPMHNLG